MKPILFSVAGLDFSTAPILAGLSALAAFCYFRRKRGLLGLSIEDFWSLMLVMAVCVMGGAVFFHLLLYNRGFNINWQFLVEHRRIPGGSFWGSFWVAVFGAYLYCRRRKLEFRPVGDIIGTAAMLALSVMRLGCFLHGCCYGRPTGLPWGVIFSDPRSAVGRSSVASELLGRALHPTQIYESAGSLLIFLFLNFYVMRLIQRRTLRPGAAFVASVLLYSTLRFFVDFLKGSDQGIFFLWGISTAQIVSIVGSVWAIILYRKWRTTGPAGRGSA